MKFGPIPLEKAEGKVLAHHIASANGGHAFRKGRPLQRTDIDALRELGRQTVYVAELEPGDLDEDSAAYRVAQAVCGSHLTLTRPSSGRANLKAECLGVLNVDGARLLRLNEIDGVTLATLPAHAVVQPRQTVATVKIIPFALPEGAARRAEKIASGRDAKSCVSMILNVLPLHPRRVSLILCGAPSARRRVIDTFEDPIQARVEALNSAIHNIEYISINEDDAGEERLSEALRAAIERGTDLILMAGDTAIMDAHDLAPRAVESLGGEVICFGAPVDPGNLLMLAAIETVPVLGVPGCARSLKLNVIDLVLPRILAGESLRRGDILALGNGGLLPAAETDEWREARATSLHGLRVAGEAQPDQDL